MNMKTLSTVKSNLLMLGWLIALSSDSWGEGRSSGVLPAVTLRLLEGQGGGGRVIVALQGCMHLWDNHHQAKAPPVWPEPPFHVPSQSQWEWCHQQEDTIASIFSHEPQRPSPAEIRLSRTRSSTVNCLFSTSFPGEALDQTPSHLPHIRLDSSVLWDI